MIMLFLALVIQLAQVRSMPDSPQAKTCAEVATMATSCCGGPQSCPCIDTDDTSQKPAPVLPATSDLKFTFLALSGADVTSGPAAAPPHLVLHTNPVAGIRAGYSGVPLNVAFCSFVI